MQYNPDELKEILNIYKAESEEIIQGLNDGFMELEKNPEDKTPLKRLFQLAHSLKGASKMIGFNSIQDLSHKLEDVLSFWKKDDVKVLPESFQLVYKVCDVLSKAVEKSIEQKSSYEDDEINLLNTQLSDYITKNQMVPVKTATEVPKDYISQKSMDIKAIMLELMFVLEKDDISEDLEDSFLVITDNLKQLQDIFVNTTFQEIKTKIQYLLKYVTEDKNAIHNIESIENKILEIRTDIYNLYKENDIVLAQKKNKQEETIKKQEKLEEKKEEEPVAQKLPNEEIMVNLDYILVNLSSAKYDREFILKIEAVVKDLGTKIKNQYAVLILNKISNILNMFETQNALVNNECYVAILQSIYQIKRLVTDEKSENVNSINLTMQRLDVLEDMFKITDIHASTSVDIHNDTSLLSQENYSNLKKNLSGLSFQEIKTLRVDTAKLDNLISQTGELLINGIKTREHIVELSKINSKLVKWNSVSKKIINYLKYLEKKGFFSIDADDGSGTFFRRAQNFFVNNAEIINEINNDFTNLYNIISEDDNKLHQTAVEIETIAKGIRVLPLATLFHSFPRMMRDIAQENNKKIDFIITGSDTTVDKKIIEEIKMPLIHILRNSVSHGIETPSDRLQNGKSETGTVMLTAKQYENNVIITVEDDGYGVNLEKVKEIAIKKGLLTNEELETISNEQIMRLLFMPGFSTDDSVSDLSGRGVGLDIVKTKINNLNGDILIESVLNKGCRVTIRLPLSMSTIKTFIILVNKQKYAIPVSAIKYVKQLHKDEIFMKNGENCIIYDDHSIPIYSLSHVLGEEQEIEENDGSYTVIIVKNQNRQAAYIVDKLLGDYEVFQKKLVPPILRIKNISGFTTLSTGEICLIINPFELIRNSADELLLSKNNTIKQIEDKKE